MNEYVMNINNYDTVRESVSRIWGDIFQKTELDDSLDFFSLGGSSVQWVSLLSDLFDAFGVSLSLKEAFTEPTVSGIARLIHVKLLTYDSATSTGNRSSTSPCSASQQRSLEMKARGTSLSIVVLLNLSGHLNIEKLQAALRHTVRTHGALCSRFHMGPPPTQEIAESFVLELPLVDVTDTSSPLETAIDEAWSKRKIPFELDSGLLLRAELFRLAPNDHLLSLLIDHIASDGVSIQIILEDVRAAYDCLVRGEPLQVKSVRQFADFARWENDWISEEGQAHVDYWISQMSGLEPTLLGRREEFSALSPYECFSYHFTCKSPTVTALSVLSEHFRLTPVMSAIAAFSVAVSETINIKDVVIDTLMSNRVRPQAEGVVGFCANSVALRIAVDSTEPLTNFLLRVREICWGGFAHQELPFSVLSRTLTEQLQIPHSRITEFYFNYSPADQGVMNWSNDLAVKRVRPRLSGSQKMGMRLGLFLWEEAGRLEGTLIYDRKTLNEIKAAEFIARFEDGLVNFSENLA